MELAGSCSLGPARRRLPARVPAVALPVAVGAIVVAVASACAQESKGQEPSTPRRVVCTTGMVADLARSVLGPGAQVQTLMGPGVDPHLYKPSRDDVARIMASELVVSNGLMLEGKMGELLSRADRGRSAIAIGSLLPAERVIRPEEADAHPDPHVWMDPALWAVAAERFAHAVAPDAPESAMHRRAAEYASTLRELDAWAREVVATIPPSQRVLITSHDAFAYLGRAYGLRVEGVQGVSTDSEPGLKRIRELVELVVSQRVPAVFIESSVSPRSVEAIVEGARARGHAVRIGGELFSDAPGADGAWEGSVAGMVDHNITTIVRALGGTAPERGWKGRLAKTGADAPKPARDPGGEPASSPPREAAPSPPREPGHAP